MQLFNYIKKWCIFKNNNKCPEPAHIFLTGGTGSGKSYLIESVYHMTNKLFHSKWDTPDNVTVLKVAHTGQAAINIGGQTVHSAFRLSTNLTMQYQPLPEKDLNTLRLKFGNLQLLIIDEISMVSKALL